MSTITHKAPFEGRFVKYGEEYELIECYAEKIINDIKNHEARRDPWDCSPYGRHGDRILERLDYSLSKLHILAELMRKRLREAKEIEADWCEV